MEFVKSGVNYVGKFRKNSKAYFSYNPGFSIFGPCNEETALVFNGQFAIKEIDLRKELEGCKTMKEAVKLFIDNEEPYGDWASVEDKEVKKYFKI